MNEVKTIKEAVKVAKDFLDEVLPIYLITKIIPQNGLWYVEINAAGITFSMKIDKNTGEVLEYSQFSEKE